jgi:uncharacterized protein (DUF433 family)
MKEIAPKIGLDSQIASGKPVILGTRVPAALVVGKLAGGMSQVEVAEEYDLHPEDILAALSYAAHLLEEEQVGVLT